MIKLPGFYYRPNVYWAHMVTLRCPGACKYCIIDGRGKCKIKGRLELDGKEILKWWNGLHHFKNQRLSLIGGEPFLHKDILEILANLENYYVTITTNCGGPFFDNNNFANLIKIHPSSSLRINTSYHPHYITAEQYIRIIKKLKEAGHFVDQIAYVKHPEIHKYQKDIDEVKKHFDLMDVPFLGFWNETKGFNAPYEIQNLYPNTNSNDYEMARSQCGISDYNEYIQMCGKPGGSIVKCTHPTLSLIIGPEGNYYHCHYKLYYDIDPVCNIKNFEPLSGEKETCAHFGKCNWCDIPRVGSNPLARKTIIPQKLPKDE